MSTKVAYKVDALRDQIRNKLEERLDDAAVELANGLDLQGRRDAWRAEAEEKVRELVAVLESAADNVLESFRIKPCPRLDSYSRGPHKKYEQAVDEANDLHDRAVRRLEAMVSDDGVVWMTPSMLRDWFGL